MLLFGFRDTNGEDVVQRFPGAHEKFVLESSLTKIDDFVESFKVYEHDTIIGFGQYGGRDNTQLRLEQVAKNVFRNKIIGKVPIVHLNTISKPIANVKLGFGMGNSWCNLVSYKITDKYPNKHYSFIHIPKHYAINKAIDEIESLLSN